jgi:predicted RNase H-like nuclease
VTQLIGVDGCAGGWIAASRDAQGALSWRRVDAFEDLFARACPSVVAVDVPIGLPERGARECDVEARRLLGVRRSSVFPAPIRPTLTATSHAEASGMRRQVEAKGVSIQTWSIMPKIVEIDCFLRAQVAWRNVVREVHPEVSFFFLNGNRPMALAKRKAGGRAQRVSALRVWCGGGIDHALRDQGKLGCKADDIIDAFVALWTAERIARGIAISIPATPRSDAYGLRMEMVA